MGGLFDKTVASAFRKIDSDGDQFFVYLRVLTVKRLVPHAAKRFIDKLGGGVSGPLQSGIAGGCWTRI